MNAGATFQRMMEIVLRDVVWKCCMVNVDDVVVYSATWQEHLQHIDQVLTAWSDANLTVNFKKCEFAQLTLFFLGYVVSKNGIHPNPEKIAAIKDFELPKSESDLRSFLGATGQFRKFIKGYGIIARPLTKLLTDEATPAWKNGTAWKDEHTSAFEALKDAVTSDLVLKHPDFTKPFLLVCDASDHGAGAMLAQLDDQHREQPVGFASCEFDKCQKKYTTTQKEGLAVVWAAGHFRAYIHGVPTVVVTDHSALTWIFTTKEDQRDSHDGL
jgi:hypothetical protein